MSYSKQSYSMLLKSRVKAFSSKIFHQSSNYMRCGIIADRYFKDSLKENIRSIRGQGSRKHFGDETKIPGDFKSDFVTNSDNKNDLYIYLVEKFVETPSNQQQAAVTYNDTILTNIENIVAENQILN